MIYDVIVVGGGPGGCAAAITCAQRGLRVMLLEQATFPRSHVGETLHPGVEPILKQLGVLNDVLAANFVRHAGVWVQWDGERRFEPYGADNSGEWRGFQAWRATFDAILLNHAKQNGVEVQQPSKANALLLKQIQDAHHQQAQVLGVRTHFGDINSHFVIDASGGRHWLAHQLGMPVLAYSPRLTAHYGYKPQAQPRCEDAMCQNHHTAPSFTACQGGWHWQAQVSQDRQAWVRLQLNQDPLAPTTAPPLAAGEAGADVTWRMAKTPAGLGYFLVGDAAAVLDPASSRGVLRALMSGMMAGHLAYGVLHNGLAREQAAQHYNHWLCDWFAHDADALRTLYTRLQHPPNWVHL